MGRGATRVRAFLVCGFSAAALANCHPPPPVSLARSDVHYSPDEYQHVFERWTRHVQVLATGFLDQITVDATYLSWDFRHAYVARYASDASISEAERQQMLATSIDTSDQEHEFYVALETREQRWGELNRPFSAWRVRLVDNAGHEIGPTRIEPVRRITAADTQYFPYTTPWREAFRLHFPRRVVIDGNPVELLGPGTRYFILRFSGPLGTANLRWDVAGS